MNSLRLVALLVVGLVFTCDEGIAKKVCKPRFCGFNNVMNQQTCQCEVRCTIQCPLYSTRTFDLRCACNQGRVMRNGRCVCKPRFCGFNQVMNQRTCECETRCTNTCPVYSTRTADCRCACNQGRAMRNGQCVVVENPKNVLS